MLEFLESLKSSGVTDWCKHKENNQEWYGPVASVLEVVVRGVGFHLSRLRAGKTSSSGN